MTLPGPLGAAGADGILVAQMVVDASQTGNEFSRALDNVAVRGRRDQERVGRDIGRNVLHGMGAEENAFAGFATIVSRRIATGILSGRRGFRRVGTSLVREIADGIAAEGNLFSQVLGGLLTTATQTIGPIFGSLFNVSGRSPAMLVIIVTLVGALVALVLGLIQGLHAVAALLATIPNLLFAIGLQAAALFFIFNGFFQALSSLSAAKTIGELNTALKGTNAQMAGIIKQLFPFKQLFHDISEASKTAFFGNLGDIFTQIYNAFTATNSLMYSMTTIAGALGTALKTVLGYFATGSFNQFMKDIADSTARWLAGFGPALASFVQGLTNFGKATLPYVEWFGTQFNNWIASIGRWFDRMANPSSGFLDWLERAKGTLFIFLDVLGKIWKSFKIFVANLDKAGGDQFLHRIGEVFDALNEFFSSESGRRAMQGLLRLTLACLALTGAVLIAIGVFLDLFNMIYSGTKVIIEGFVLLGRLLSAIFQKLVEFVGGLLGRLIGNITNWLKQGGNNILSFLQSIPGMIIGMFAKAGSWLVDAGRDLVQGFINGAINKLGFLAPLIRSALTNFGLGFLVGGGNAIQRKSAGTTGGGAAAPAGGAGAGGTTGNAVQHLGGALQGPNTVTNSSNQGTNIAMASGAVQVIFQSTEPPTTEQARAVGGAASTEYLSMLNKLSARTM